MPLLLLMSRTNVERSRARRAPITNTSRGPVTDATRSPVVDLARNGDRISAVLRRLWGGVAMVVLLATGCSSDTGPSGSTLRLDRGETAAETAVPLELPPGSGPAVDGPSVLSVGGDGGPTARFQRGPALLGGDDLPLESTWVGLVPTGLSTGSYAVQSGDTTSAFSFRRSEGRLTVLEGGEPVFGYNFGVQLPEDVPEDYRRTGYVHPVWGPGGTLLTDDFPDDHYHHRGVSWMWPRVRVGGEQYDLWHLQGIRQHFERWLVRRTGPAAATVGADLAWRTETGTVVDEKVWMRAYSARQAARAIDVRLTLEATDRPVTLLGQSNQDKGYGGFSFRFAPRDSTVIVSPEGREADSDHRRLRWADQSGLFAGVDGRRGAAVFQHPSNPGFPAQWTLRHYGFLGVAWPGNDGYELVPGEPVTLRYRLWLHEGGAGSGRVEAAYREFAQPPEVSVVP